MASGHAMQSTPATALSTPATSQSPHAGSVRWKRMATTASATPPTKKPSPTTKASAHSVTSGQTRAITPAAIQIAART